MKRRRSQAPLVPERIGRYDVLLPIASGGMGTVYLARSHGLGGFERYAALKVMHAHLRQEEAFASDLIEEAKLAGRIQHPNVVQVIDVGDDPHGVFLVMEYIEGDSLAGLLRLSRRDDASKRVDITPNVGLRILHDALLGLHAAHELTDAKGEQQQLVHRDFSPQNILVGIDGVSRLTDFGVAKASTRITHTATGFIKGKVHYMSPEQAKTEALDRRCDIWAAGVIAWEMLAGKRLYRERTDTGILLQLVTEPPPRLRTVRPAMPKVLDDAVAFALSTAVKSRCPTAKQLADELAMGADKLGGLADLTEIADFVKDKAGPLLAKRREQIEEVVKLRAEISTIAQSATVDSELSATPISEEPPPQIEEQPTVNLGSRRPAEDDTATIRMEDEPDAIAEELRAAVASATAGESEPREEPSVTEISQSLSVQPEAADSATGGQRRPLWPAAAAAGVVGIIALGLMASGDEPAPAPGVNGSTQVASAPAPPPHAPASGTAASGQPDSAETAASELTVNANAAVAELRIGSRTVKVDPKRKSFTVELEAEESASEVEVWAIAADGRRTRVTLAANSNEIAVKFPVGGARRRSPTGKKPAPLAPSPYD